MQEVSHETMQSPLQTIFMFVNSSSGSGIGNELLEKNFINKEFVVPYSINRRDVHNKVSVLFSSYNMREPSEREQGLTEIKQITNKIEAGYNQLKRKPLVVVCGGDGTMMWVVKQLALFGVDPLLVAFTILPLGTGNDLSQEFGWGKGESDICGKNNEHLIELIVYWISAVEQPLDIWQIYAEVQEYGKFQKVQNEENMLLPEKTYHKDFCNYFSFGVDGKVGYSFDLHRTSTRLGNLVMYGALGLVKSFTKTKTLGDLVQSIISQTEDVKGLKETLESVSIDQIKLHLDPNIETDTRGVVLMNQSYEYYNTYSNHLNFLALNINSFMGGVKNIWANAKTPAHLKAEQLVPGKHSDGVLQFLSFSSSVAIGLEKTIGGFADKFCQYGGALRINFKTRDPEQKYRTYLQIDGQYIRFTHPKSVTISKSQLTHTGKINFLRKPDIQEKTCC